MVPHFHPLRVANIQRETPDCVSITFDVPDDLREAYIFTQGQYLTLRAHLDNEEVRRSYSICSSPFDEQLTVAVKKVPHGKFSTYANDILRVGDILDVMTPTGNFFTPLHAEHRKQYVAFAAGSGITPILSIIKATLSAEPHSQFILFYGNKNFDHIIFREQLIDLKNRYVEQLSVHHVLSRESMGSPLFKGRLSGEKCVRFAQFFFNPTLTDEFFLCGPEDMTTDIAQTLSKLGIDRKHIHIELFAAPTAQKIAAKKEPASELTEIEGFESQITVIIDGHTFDFLLYSEGESILDAAHDYGADLPYACKGGVCSTCKAKLIEGEVRMDLNYALEPDELAAGYVLTCQTHPKTKRVVLSFDEN